jgi:hypothetical protein
MAGVNGIVASNEMKNLGFQAESSLVLHGFATPPQRQLGGSLKISGLSGGLAMATFDRHGIEATADLGLPEGAVQIRRLQAQLQQGNQPCGMVAVQGDWNLERGAGNLTLAIQDLTATGLRPFLQAALGEKQLRSANLVADIRVQHEAAGQTAIKATADLKDLVVHDPAGKLPQSPLAGSIAVDAGGANGKLTIRQGDLKLTPTDRAKNELRLTGDLDLSKTNALRGALKLAADSIDVTPYFDLFAAGTNTTAQTPPEPRPAPGSPPQEPEAMQLPIELLTVDSTIGKFYLRDVALENWRTGVRIEGSRIQVQPLQLTLNGAPVQGDVRLNLGVPGYEYAIQFSADGVPVKPVASSFFPLLKGRIEGKADASMQIAGAGVTGVNLQKHLQGQVGLSVTNANLKLVDTSARKGILGLLTTVLASALNIRELRDQPIMDIVARAKAGSGNIDLTQGTIRSASFAAAISGSIPIADDLMKSPISLPVDISLNRDVAQRARLLGPNQETNVAYVPLPPIVAIEGTVGEPSVKVDKVQTAMLVARGIGGLVGSQAGGTITNVANIVGSVATGGTNAVGNLLRGVGGLLRGSTNDPGANAPVSNAPVKAPLGGLLKGLFEKKTNQPPKSQP